MNRLLKEILPRLVAIPNSLSWVFFKLPAEFANWAFRQGVNGLVGPSWSILLNWSILSWAQKRHIDPQSPHWESSVFTARQLWRRRIGKPWKLSSVSERSFFSLSYHCSHFSPDPPPPSLKTFRSSTPSAEYASNFSLNFIIPNFLRFLNY